MGSACDGGRGRASGRSAWRARRPRPGVGETGRQRPVLQPRGDRPRRLRQLRPVPVAGGRRRPDQQAAPGDDGGDRPAAQPGDARQAGRFPGRALGRQAHPWRGHRRQARGLRGDGHRPPRPWPPLRRPARLPAGVLPGRWAGRPGRPPLWGQAYYALGGDAEAERGAAYLRDYYAFTGPFAERIAAGNLTSPQMVKDLVRGYEEAECDHLVLLPTVADIAQLERLAEVLD